MKRRESSSRSVLETARVVARAAGLPFVDLEEYTVSPGILAKFPRDVLERERCVPVIANRRRVIVATDDPARAIALVLDPPPALRRAPKVEAALTTPAGLEATLARRRGLRI